ncbi:hypothetical protein B0H21DRAFT_825688 [Amylocystis lapponica]|nr:hypothetical protein B0H21DRAFT_825688 [Amylocystis lapponica]
MANADQDQPARACGQGLHKTIQPTVHLRGRLGAGPPASMRCNRAHLKILHASSDRAPRSLWHESMPDICALLMTNLDALHDHTFHSALWAWCVRPSVTGERVNPHPPRHPKRRKCAQSVTAPAQIAIAQSVLRLLSLNAYTCIAPRGAHHMVVRWWLCSNLGKTYLGSRRKNHDGAGGGDLFYIRQYRTPVFLPHCLPPPPALPTLSD